MLEFKEVTYLATSRIGRPGVIRTTGGYALIDYDNGYYWSPLTTPSGVSNIPWHFLKEDSTLYIMKEEPNFYA